MELVDFANNGKPFRRPTHDLARAIAFKRADLLAFVWCWWHGHPLFMSDDEIKQALAALDARLSKLEEPEVGGKRSRAESLEETILHCAKCGLSEDDARWLYAKMEVSGWRNNGKVIRNWRSLVTAWKLANIFPSQKRNGNGARSIQDLRTVLEAKKAERDELVRKYYNDSGAFHEWTNEPARQRFIVLKGDIFYLQSRIGQSA